MPSAYILARDNLEQAKAILSSEVWHDNVVAHLLDCAILRLNELEQEMSSEVPLPLSRIAEPEPKREVKHMIWLDP